MLVPRKTQVHNRLLQLFSPEDFDRVAPRLETVALPRMFAIAQPNTPSAYCYFPESGIGSIVATTPEGQQAEVAIVGREGMAPLAAVLRAGTDPYSTFMQVPGNGYRIATDVLTGAIDASDALKSMFSRYAQAHAVQAAYTALSNAVHQIDERLARWLLMCDDRTSGRDIALTHELLAVMLGVRRPSITTALHVLEGNRFIVSQRGVIIIRDRAALEAFARDAYGTPEREYERLLGSMNSRPGTALPQGGDLAGPPEEPNDKVGV